jgi:hypothetical protein
LNEKVQLLAFSAHSLEEILPMEVDDAFLSFGEPVVGVDARSFEEAVVDVAALNFDVDIQRESGSYVLQPFEYQSVVGNSVLTFEMETQKVGYVFLKLEKTVFGIAEVFPFEMETQKAGCVLQSSEQKAVVGAVAEAHKLGYVFQPFEKGALSVVDGT